MASKPVNDEPVPAYAVSGTGSAWYAARQLSDVERARFRRIAKRSAKAKQRAVNGEGPVSGHPVNVPNLDPLKLMPKLAPNGLRALSLFSGGGGLDLGFDQAGYTHVTSFEILDFAADTLKLNRPNWDVRSGKDGDVKKVDWKVFAGKIDVVHGGPPCQPFSNSGRQKGESDPRDMFPEFVRCVLSVQPKAFVAENVPGLFSGKFSKYLEAKVFGPLRPAYQVQTFVLEAASFGVPQRRRRVFFVGIRKDLAGKSFAVPAPTRDASWMASGRRDSTAAGQAKLPRCMGVREALGLPANGHDDLAPTLRSTLTGPRHTTSILSSTSSAETWAGLGIWPNGVAETRVAAQRFPAANGNFRLSVDDCKVIQGFPKSWKFRGPVYKALGQIGNSVAPPMAYAVAKAVAEAIR